MTKEQIVGLIDLIDHGLQQGTSRVEQVHRSIAEKPWKITQHVEPLSSTSQTIMDAQGQWIGGIYASVRVVGKVVTSSIKAVIVQSTSPTNQ